MAFDLQSAIKAVMRSERGTEKVEQGLSRHFVQGEIGQVYRGIRVAIPPEDWVMVREMSFDEYMASLERLARDVDLARHPEAHRGVKKTGPKRK